MALAMINQEAFDTLPQDLQKEYIKQDSDNYLLNVESGESGLTLANVTDLHSALQKERASAREALKKLKTFDGLEVEQAREALKFKEAFDSGELSDDAKARLEAKEKQLTERFESQRKQLSAQIEEIKTASSTREQALLKQLEATMLGSAVRSAIVENNGLADLLEPFVKSRARLIEEDGNFKVEVLDDKGTPMLSRKAGSITEPMGISEFVASLREDERYAPAFKGTSHSGSGKTSQGVHVSATGRYTISAEDARDTRKYQQAREQALKAGQTLEIV